MCQRGASLHEERSEESDANREGEASGGATLIAKNFKKAISLAEAPSHEKHFAPLDVRGLWHARPLPSILLFTSNGLWPRPPLLQLKIDIPLCNSHL